MANILGTPLQLHLHSFMPRPCRAALKKSWLWHILAGLGVFLDPWRKPPDPATLLHFARFQNCMDNSARFFYHLEMPSGFCLPQRQWPLSTLLDDPWETLSRELISTRSPLQHNSQFGISFQMNLYFHNVFDILFTHVFVCACVCLNVCHSTQGEVREQLTGVPSLLQHMRPRNWTRAEPGSRCLYWLSHQKPQTTVF